MNIPAETRTEARVQIARLEDAVATAMRSAAPAAVVRAALHNYGLLAAQLSNALREDNLSELGLPLLTARYLLGDISEDEYMEAL